MTQQDRQRLIHRLIAFDLSDRSYATAADREAFFTMLLREGFAGYLNMTDDELRQEAYARDLEDL